MDAINIISIFMITFNIVVYCPILVYFLSQYRKYEKQEAMTSIKTNAIHSRNSFLVYAINFLAIFAIFTERIYMASVCIWNIIEVPFWTVALFLAILWWALMDLFAIKVYHLYYVQQYNQSIADKSWKKGINPNEKDWYIIHKHTYGDAIYLMKITFIPYLLSVIIDSVIFAFLVGQGLVLDFSHLTLATIPTCIAMYVFWKARKLNDIYNIRNEIFYQFVILLSVLSVYMIIFMVCHYLADTHTHEHTHTEWIVRFEWTTYLFITDGVTFALALFSTAYPVYLTRKNKRLEPQLIQLVSNEQIETPAADKSTTSKTTETSNSIQGINSVISKYDSFKGFMEYLVSEFCAENLLFLVEIIQIKYAYQQRNNNLVRIPKTNVISSQFIAISRNDNKEEQLDGNGTSTVSTPDLKEKSSSLQKKDNDLYQVIDFNVNPNDIDTNKCIYTYLFHDEGSIMTQMCLTSSLPLSNIINQNENNLYAQMKMLYKKYIDVDSTHELNVSFFVRDALRNYFTVHGEEMDKDHKMFNIMDECCIEIIRLLKSSFRRFMQTEKFKQVVNDTDIGRDKKDDVSMKQLFNSDKVPVIRNATSYSRLKHQYKP